MIDFAWEVCKGMQTCICCCREKMGMDLPRRYDGLSLLIEICLTLWTAQVFELTPNGTCFENLLISPSSTSLSRRP